MVVLFGCFLFCFWGFGGGVVVCLFACLGAFLSNPVIHYECL